MSTKLGLALILISLAGFMGSALAQNGNNTLWIPIQADWWDENGLHGETIYQNSETGEILKPLPYSSTGQPYCHDPLYKAGVLGEICTDEGEESTSINNQSEGVIPPGEDSQKADTGKSNDLPTPELQIHIIHPNTDDNDEESNDDESNDDYENDDSNDEHKGDEFLNSGEFFE